MIFASTLALPAAHATLYSFTTHTFTSCGVSGPTGPSQSACRSAYSTVWDESNANFTVISGIQYWTVPTTGRYYIDAYGAGGGGALGGGGARIADTVILAQGEIVRVLVGQTPSTNASAANAGGGGTFVTKSPFNNDDSILIIAGGGGGTESGSSQNSLAHGSITTSGNNGVGIVSATGAGAGGTSGNGGGTPASDNGGGGGGGFYTAGTRNTNWDNNGGFAYVNGGNGATAGTGYVASLAGGFGGGGGAAGKNFGGGAGGGGGYSGGGGSDNQTNFSGGGGGSFFANGLNVNRITTVDAQAENTNGSVSITLLSALALGLTSAGGATTAQKGRAINLTATTEISGRITFYANGKKIARCIGLTSDVGNKTCAWTPTTMRPVSLYAILNLNGALLRSSTLNISVVRRSGTR